jgi:predicted RNA binding protein YcfA (HicA-like mRNA interferase family)
MDDLAKVIREARRQGWKVERTRKSHWRFVPPEAGRRILVTSGTPSDHRTMANHLARMIREGFAHP